jgi:hypothetical protein
MQDNNINYVLLRQGGGGAMRHVTLHENNVIGKKHRQTRI